MTQTLTIDEPTQAAITEMIGHARAGRLADARQAGKTALPRVGSAGPIHALLGRMGCESGDFVDGIEHLAKARLLLPGDRAVLTDLTAALIQMGRFRDAMDVATLDQCAADPSLQMARLRGYAAQQAENYPAAVVAYRLVVDRAPDDAGTWNNLGNSEAAVGNNEAAVQCLERAIALDPQSPPTRLNLALSLVNSGRGGDALAALQRATKDFPQDHLIHFELGRLAGDFGDTTRAIEAFECARKLNPRDVETLVKLGQQHATAWQMKEASAAYDDALELQPDMPGAHIGRALIHEHDNKGGELDRLAGVARAAGVDAGAQAFLDALAHRRAKRWAQGLAAAEAASPDYDAIRRAQLIGECNDRLDRPANAFAAFTEMNRLASEAPHAPMALADRYRDTARHNLALLSRPWFDSWTAPVAPGPDERPSPMFLFGFPRSGTTLLDTMLMGHPRVRVLEEKQAFPTIERSIGDMANLADMDATKIRDARDRYWAGVAELTDLPDNCLLVDKSPLYLNKLPYIWRLFPDAKFVLTLRHPMDVVLSCFITNFRPNAAMANFLDLQRAAELYDLSFASFVAARDLLHPSVFTVVYERMIADKDAELRPLFEWLGLDWHEDALDHQATAAKRGIISTASYAQVHEPLYTRSAGRWARYRDQLKPVEAIIAPWIERFGYSRDDPAQLPPRTAA